MFVPSKPFQPSLKFVGKARGGWRGLLGTNTVAYSENLKIMVVKSFIVQAPGFAFPFRISFKKPLYFITQMSKLHTRSSIYNTVFFITYE